ncbi:MAG: prepilin-type N-terminal cleavage/methylation domain-containing protein [Patescibacteria group bacterium]|jgi:Tfp pilus assembly protein PilW
MEYRAKGFTLIELLLYIACASVILLLGGSFLHMVLETRVRQEVMSTVEEEGRFAMNTIIAEIRTASHVAAPLPAITSTSLLLDMPGGTQETFVLSGTVLVFTRGVNPSLSLTSNLVEISNLQFQNVSAENAGDSIKITFTLSHVNSSNKSEYTYVQTFTSATTIRP